MNILAITAEEFQTAALAWLGAGFAVVTAFCIGLALVLPRIASLKAAVDAMHTRQDRQTDRQNVQEQTVATVALAVKPQSSPASEP